MDLYKTRQGMAEEIVKSENAANLIMKKFNRILYKSE